MNPRVPKEQVSKPQTVCEPVALTLPVLRSRKNVETSNAMSLPSMGEGEVPLNHVSRGVEMVVDVVKLKV